MGLKYFEEKTFDKCYFTKDPLTKGEYELCVFKNCEFSNSDLSEIKFIECTFAECNLSMAGLTKTVFRDVAFRDCKMLGLMFSHLNEYGLTAGFEGCNLANSSFYRTKMRKTTFTNSSLKEADFPGCDLSGSVFDNCDFAGARFENTICEKVDFSTSYNYSIDPVTNRVRRAKFSLRGLPGLLDNYDIQIEY